MHTKTAICASWALLFLAVVNFSLLLPVRPILAQPLEAPKAADVPDFKVRIKINAVDGKPPVPDRTFRFSLAAGKEPVQFKGGEWSPWLSSTREGIQKIIKQHPTSLSYYYWHVRVDCNLEPAAERIQLQVETAIADQDGVRGEHSQAPAELLGPRLGLILWKDGPGPVHMGSTHIDTLAGHDARVYYRALSNAALLPEERPRKIVFADSYMRGDDDEIAVREGIAHLAGLGINVLGLQARSPLQDSRVRELARQNGIQRISGGISNPPELVFDFRPPEERHKALAEFVQHQVAPLLKAGWRAQDVAFWFTYDVPGWYYPSVYDEIIDDPRALEAFHAYLKARGLSPADLGKANWEQVEPTGRRQYKTNDPQDLPARRLFYWSNRFVPWAAARYLAEVTRAYEETLYPNVPVLVNFNNFMGRTYTPGLIASNPELRKSRPRASAAMGQPDWMEFGRERATTGLITEDWFGDAQAPQWSFYAARLRAAAELGGVGWGGEVIPRAGGQRLLGITQKAMTLVGHGSRMVWFSAFGPEYSFPGNGYSEKPAAYRAIATAARMTAKAEDLLPGRQRPAQVAILSPQSSQFWDLEEKEYASWLHDAANKSMTNARMGYMSEMYHLYLALQHAAVPVRFVDEQQLAEGVQGTLKDCKVLYVTAPDLPAEAVAGLLVWVRDGGTLVTTAGAGLFDRYHQPHDELSQASGIKLDPQMKPVRMGVAKFSDVSARGSLKWADGELVVFGEREKLAAPEQGAQVMASFEDGSPAVTNRPVGAGRIIHFACYPGICYRKSATDNTDRLISGFSDAWRVWIVGPVSAAAVEPPVIVDKPLVEAPALYSEDGRGVVVTLLNWSGQQQNVQLAVAVDKDVRAVESVERGALKFRQDKGRVSVGLLVGDVDMVKIYYR